MADGLPFEFLDFINKGEKFLVAGHKEPDGDCIGSQLALASALRRMGKEAILCSVGPFNRSEIRTYERFFKPEPDERDKAGARVIVADCSSLDRTGVLQKHLEGLSFAIIDHHEAGNSLNNCNPGLSAHYFSAHYIDVKAPSTTFLVKKLIEALGLELTREEAEFIFFGLCTDTGFFRHVGPEGAETFEAAASLIRSGANPKAAHSGMYGGKSLDSRKLMGYMLINAESFFDGKLIISFEEYEYYCQYGPEGRDSDTLYQLLQSVAGVEVIVLIRQETPEKCTVGLRSRSWVDVGDIAQSLGGGGHKNAAGLCHAGTINDLKPKIIQAFEKKLDPANR